MTPRLASTGGSRRPPPKDPSPPAPEDRPMTAVVEEPPRPPAAAVVEAKKLFPAIERRKVAAVGVLCGGPAPVTAPVSEPRPAIARSALPELRQPATSDTSDGGPAKIVPFTVDGSAAREEVHVDTSFPFVPDTADNIYWIGEKLLEEEKITAEQLEEAKRVYTEKATSAPFSDTLEDLQLATPQRVAQIIADHYHLAYIDKLAVDRDIARRVPQSTARGRSFIPFKTLGDTIEIVVADPAVYNQDTAVVDFPGYTKHTIHVSARKEILAALDGAWTTPVAITDGDKYVEKVIKDLIDEGASDAHFEPWPGFLTIRKRVNGDLTLHENVGADYRASVIRALENKAKIKIEDRRFPEDGQFKINQGARNYTCRVSTMPQVHGVKVEVRIGTDGVMERSFEDLGMWPDQQKLMKQIIGMTEGAVYSTGPTGCGKSTLQYSSVSQMPVAALNIVSIEDPPEYDMPGINQVPIRSDIGFTYAMALEGVLRQDPDVIVMGEMRDKETCVQAIRAALTGHLFMGTLHTNDAPGAIVRLMELGIEPYLVAQSTAAVIAQRLVKRLCNQPNCRRPVRDAESLKEQYGIKDGTLYEANPNGCPHCKKGYDGRIGIFEIMVLKGRDEDSNYRIESIITRLNRKDNPSTLGDLRREMKRHGMITLRDDAMRKVAAGIVSLSDALAQVSGLSSDIPDAETDDVTANPAGVATPTLVLDPQTTRRANNC